MLTHAHPHITHGALVEFSFIGTPAQTELQAVALIAGARAGVSTSACVQAIDQAHSHA